MQNLELGARVLSIVAFLFYGFHCLLSEKMVTEFKRYKLEKFRVLTGVLEVAGALGLVAGSVFPVLILVASGGLTVLMFLGIATRLRIRDTFTQTLPALILLMINGFIFIVAIEAIRMSKF